LHIATAFPPGELTLERGHVPFNEMTEGPSVARWYRATPAVNGAATVVFQYEATELNGLTENELQLFRQQTASSAWLPFATVSVPSDDLVSANVDSLGLITAFDSTFQVSAEETIEEGSGFRLFPNPTAGPVFLDVPTDGTVRNVEILGPDGRLVRRVAVQGVWGQGAHALSVEGLANGLHFVRIDHRVTLPLSIQWSAR
jgi:hypothetical protein